ncbi:MAG: RDD family protein [Caulobacterales bacterium]|nr:RDD family protein [Caulobacterales bacterium]
MSEAKEIRRLSGGFWRRTAAFLIDGLFISLVLSALAMLIYEPSGTRIRMRQAIFTQGECEPAATVPAVIGPAPKTGEPSASLCVSRFAGREIDRYVQVQTDAMAPGLRRQAPVDAAGKVVDSIYLDGLWGLALIFVLTVCEGLFGGGPGKLALGLRVVAIRTGRASIWRSLVRNGLIYSGIVAAGLLSAGMFAGLSFSFDPSGETQAAAWAIPDWILPALLTLWSVIAVIAMIFQRPDPFYDRLAGTRVERR